MKKRLLGWFFGLLVKWACAGDWFGGVVAGRLAWVPRWLRAAESGLVKKVVSIILLIVVLGALIPVLWPMMTDTTTEIGAMNGTDSATGFMQTIWPIVLLVIGIGIAAGVVYYALRKFGVLGGGG